MINKELARIQAELKAPKDLGEDESIKFEYRNCEQMFAQLKPLFNGLTRAVVSEYGCKNRIYVQAMARFSNSVGTQPPLAREPEGVKFMGEPQM
ncbi:hypothetical protein ATZ36_05805 [Candidatus Endomicrobiellum trichonymphae]|jgi:hypothetical protein|uniref:Uncharacterized protein n=1 Tax=Endomicrobium trichonymphae TaxID=1408204 RepID=A0A1E5IIE2_ENDTX|nr:hypothetical protein ATZ36_05805 [Candidatus Endomicrobium trichonymphae]